MTDTMILRGFSPTRLAQWAKLKQWDYTTQNDHEFRLQGPMTINNKDFRFYLSGQIREMNYGSVAYLSNVDYQKGISAPYRTKRMTFAKVLRILIEEIRQFAEFPASEIPQREDTIGEDLVHRLQFEYSEMLARLIHNVRVERSVLQEFIRSDTSEPNVYILPKLHMLAFPHHSVTRDTKYTVTVGNIVWHAVQYKNTAIFTSVLNTTTDGLDKFLDPEKQDVMKRMSPTYLDGFLYHPERFEYLTEPDLLVRLYSEGETGPWWSVVEVNLEDQSIQLQLGTRFLHTYVSNVRDARKPEPVEMGKWVIWNNQLIGTIVGGTEAQPKLMAYDVTRKRSSDPYDIEWKQTIVTEDCIEIPVTSDEIGTMTEDPFFLELYDTFYGTQSTVQATLLYLLRDTIPKEKWAELWASLPSTYRENKESTFQAILRTFTESRGIQHV